MPMMLPQGEFGVARTIDLGTFTPPDDDWVGDEDIAAFNAVSFMLAPRATSFGIFEYCALFYDDDNQWLAAGATAYIDLQLVEKRVMPPADALPTSIGTVGAVRKLNISEMLTENRYFEGELAWRITDIQNAPVGADNLAILVRYR